MYAYLFWIRRRTELKRPLSVFTQCCNSIWLFVDIQRLNEGIVLRAPEHLGYVVEQRMLIYGYPFGHGLTLLSLYVVYRRYAYIWNIILEYIVASHISILPSLTMVQSETEQGRHALYPSLYVYYNSPKTLKNGSRVENVLSRNQRAGISPYTYIPAPGGVGASYLLCLYYIYFLIVVFSTISRGLAEGVCYVVAYN